MHSQLLDGEVPHGWQILPRDIDSGEEKRGGEVEWEKTNRAKHSGNLQNSLTKTNAIFRTCLSLESASNPGTSAEACFLSAADYIQYLVVITGFSVVYSVKLY